MNIKLLKPVASIIIFSSLLLTACKSQTKLIGGPCKYETVKGQVEVVSVDDSNVKFNFEPGDLPVGIDINPENKTKYHVGQKLNAEIDKITQGTCTPFIIKQIN